MSITGFTSLDFQTFQIDGLEPRMSAIRERIQPKFKSFGEALLPELSVLAGDELHLHIAQHARRKINPPKDTWLALCHNKRGYKKHPHFQLGLFDDRLFIWLAFIYELPDKAQIAQQLLESIEQVHSLVPSHYVLSMDHLKKEAVTFSTIGIEDFHQKLESFRTIKKAELLIGQHILVAQATQLSGSNLLEQVMDTYRTLMPLYHLSRSIHFT